MPGGMVAPSDWTLRKARLRRAVTAWRGRRWLTAASDTDNGLSAVKQTFSDGLNDKLSEKACFGKSRELSQLSFKLLAIFPPE